MSKYIVTVTETWIIDADEVDKKNVKADLKAIVSDTNSINYEFDYRLIDLS